MPCRGSPGPHPGGKLRGLARGVRGLQAHTWGEGVLQAHTWVVSRPTPRGIFKGPHMGGVSHHALRQTPPLTATAVGGMHPTGMHSCFSNILVLPPPFLRGLTSHTHTHIPNVIIQKSYSV